MEVVDVCRCVMVFFQESFQNLGCKNSTEGITKFQPAAFEAVTMYIENAGLSPSHAEIKFTAATCQYFLRVGILRDLLQVHRFNCMILLR